VNKHGFDHRELVKIAARWLKNTEKCSVVVCELRSQPEEPDAIGWKSRLSTLVECKTSHSDFTADQAKLSRKFKGDPIVALGMGVYRYYLAPEGIILANEIPDGWGLLEVSFSGRVSRVVESRMWAQSPMAIRSELGLALSALRRLQCGERDAGGKIQVNEAETSCGY
jgi:hypothetical protein